MLNGVINILKDADRNILYMGLIIGLGIVGIVSGATSAHADNITTNVNINPSLTLTIPTSTISMDLDPAATTFASQDLTVTVGTNNPVGYNLILTTDTTDLTDSSTSKTIPTLDNSTTLSDFPANHWGYKKDNSNYLPFETNIELLSSDGPANDDTTTLNFASKIDYQQPAGNYNLALNFALVARQSCSMTIEGTMQELNPCADMPVGTTGTLTDSRDSKTYTVAKLNDGNIWMTKNLDLAGGTKLYSETSDVPSGYPESGGTGYYTLPASETISSGTSLPSTAFSDNTKAYVFNTGNETTSQADCTSSSPCNSYYSWLAATAGSGSSASPADGGRVAYSICPKGWKLPSATTEGVSRDNNGYTGGDFYKLATQYGMATGNYYENPDNAPTFYSQAGTGTTPNFLLAGRYDSGSFNDGGSLGYYWSSSSRSSTNAYRLYFRSSDVDSASSIYRRYGFPVRCLLSGSSS